GRRIVPEDAEMQRVVTHAVGEDRRRGRELLFREVAEDHGSRWATSFQRSTTPSPVWASRLRIEREAGSRPKWAAFSRGRPDQRAIRTRSRWPWAKTRTSPPGA